MDIYCHEEIDRHKVTSNLNIYELIGLKSLSDRALFVVADFDYFSSPYYDSEFLDEIYANINNRQKLFGNNVKENKGSLLTGRWDCLPISVAVYWCYVMK